MFSKILGLFSFASASNTFLQPRSQTIFMAHPKQLMGNLDYFYALKELAPQLEGARLDGAYDYFGGFRLRFRKEGAQYNLAVELGVRLHLTQKLPESQKEPSSFVKLLRAHLDNAVLEKVQQINFDRLVSLKFSRRRTLVFEQLGKGNALLLDENGKIIRPMRGEEFSSRKLRKGEIYSPPPNEKMHPMQVNNLVFAKPEERAVAALSKTVNLAPFYLEEALVRAGFPKTALAGEIEAAAVLSEAKQFLNQHASATVYLDAEGEPAAFAPFQLKKFGGEQLVSKSFVGFSEALDEYYCGHFEGQAIVRSTAKLEEEKERLQGAFEQQKKALEKMVLEEREAREAGEWIYSNYALVEQVLLGAREGFNRKMDEKQAGEALTKKFGKKIVLRNGAIEISEK